MFDRTQGVAKRYLNVNTYMGLDSLKANAQLLGGLAKQVFKVPSAKRTETFQEALTRLNLSEADIQHRQRVFFRLSVSLLLGAVAVLLYGFYIFSEGRLAAFGLDLAVVVLLLAQAFRYHFWFFQVKNRKLGCTAKEWWNSNIQGDVK